MSWSVSGSGTPAEVRGQLSPQFKFPLADGTAGLSDVGEKQTVQQVFDLCEQILSTFDPDCKVTIAAYGSMGFTDWPTKTGCFQSVHIEITPQ